MTRSVLLICLLLAGCADIPLENQTHDPSSGGDEAETSTGEVVVSRQGERFRATRTEVGQVPFAAGGDIDASTVNGAIAVRVTSRSDAHVLANLWAVGDTEAEARQRLATLRLDVSGPGLEAHVRTSDWNNKGGSMTISLPVDRVGDVAATTTNGAVSLNGVRAGPVALETTNGAIACSLTTPSLTVETTNGAIACTGTFDDVDAHSTNGAVSIDGKAAASGTWNLDSTNAVIQLTVVEDSTRGYDVQAETTNGQITFDFEQTEEIDSSSSYVSQSRHERTNGYSARSIQTAITMDTTNGPIVAGS